MAGGVPWGAGEAGGAGPSVGSGGAGLPEAAGGVGVPGDPLPDGVG